MALHPDEYEHAARLRDDLNDAFHVLVVQYKRLGDSEEEAYERAEEFLRGELKESATKINQDFESLSPIAFFHLLANQKWKALSIFVFAPLASAFFVGAFFGEHFLDDRQPVKEQADDLQHAKNKPKHGNIPTGAEDDSDAQNSPKPTHAPDFSGERTNRNAP